MDANIYEFDLNVLNIQREFISFISCIPWSAATGMK